MTLRTKRTKRWLGTSPCEMHVLYSLVCRHIVLEESNGAFVPASLANMAGETKNLDVASDSDLTECSADLAPDEEEELARMHILLLQANWATPVRKRKAMTAKAKRKRFGKVLRRFRATFGDCEPRMSNTQSPHALDDVGAPNI